MIVSGDENQHFPTATPSVSLRSTASPKGTPLAKRVSFVLIGQRPEEANCCPCALCPCQSLHLRGRWHFAKRNDGRGSLREMLWTANPFSLASLDSFPEGDALGKEGKFRPYRSTARRSQLLPVRFVPLPKPPPLGGGGISQSEMTEGVLPALLL